MKSKALSLFHRNVGSLPKRFDNFKNLINQLQIEFDLIGITESRLIKGISPATNINLKDYVIEHTPTESSAGGALLYVYKKSSYQPQVNLSQFFFLLDFFSNNYTCKRNAEVYDWSRFNKNSFLDDFNITNYNSFMEIERINVYISFNNYLSKVNSLIVSHVPMKKPNKQQQKFLQKLWFTAAIQNSTHRKNKLFKNISMSKSCD